MSAPDRRSAFGAIAGAYHAPVIAGWAILSFLPAFGVFNPEASTLSLVGDVVFFVTGFAGLFSTYLLLIFLATVPAQRRKIIRPMSGRIGIVSVYATIWLAGYGYFRYAVV